VLIHYFLTTSCGVYLDCAFLSGGRVFSELLDIFFKSITGNNFTSTMANCLQGVLIKIIPEDSYTPKKFRLLMIEFNLVSGLYNRKLKIKTTTKIKGESCLNM